MQLQDEAGVDGSAVRTRRGGRPTREQAQSRDEHLLAMAAGLFEARGFEGASIDALAEAAGVGKATVYARFGDKSGLFLAVYRRRVRELLSPLADEARAILQAEELGDIGETLLGLGMALMRRAVEPHSVSLNRVILAEAYRFPELAELIHREGWCRTVEIVSSILQAYDARGVLRIASPDLSADLFLNLVLGREQRKMMLGLPGLDQAGLERRTVAAVEVFLRGTLGR